MDYKNLADEQLVSLTQNNDESATHELYSRYKNMVRSIIRKKKLFLPDGDLEDLLQEGMLGLFKAVRTYSDEGVKFSSYAYTCIERTLISAIEKSNCGKNFALNNSVPLDVSSKDVESNLETSPEAKYIISETVQEFFTEAEGALSKFEYNVLRLYLDGYSYQEIGEKTNRNVKAIDNAVQRIKNKVLDKKKKD